jgi:NAD(P)-dependent dehydrogenase (short-subunit alcohol dehydrogenase family)
MATDQMNHIDHVTTERHIAARGKTATTTVGAALVTGASSGTGHTTARALAAAGYPTTATARHPEALTDLAAAGCQTLALDVTDEASMQRAVDAAHAAFGGVSILVNNAGYGETGPLEEIPLAAIRRQFETNVFGLLRLCQLVLPGMRERRYGRIVNVSTMGGVITMLGGGAYYASKHAVESLSDALRAEVAPFGVDVIVIRPGLVWSHFNAAARASVGLIPRGNSYDELKRALATKAFGEDPGFPRWLGTTPDQVARVIVRAIQAKRPRTRYTITAMARVVPALRHVLPDRAWDAMTRRSLGVAPEPA